MSRSRHISLAGAVVPETERRTQLDRLFGIPIPDPYQWLEDPADPGTLEWSDMQHEYASRTLDDLGVIPSWVTAVADIASSPVDGVPIRRGDLEFFERRGPGQHPVLIARAASGQERVLVDPGLLDPAGTTVLDAWEPNSAGTQIAYQLSQRGLEQGTLMTLDVASGRDLGVRISGTRYSSVSWLPDDSGFFYVGASGSFRDIRLHILVGTGADPVPGRNAAAQSMGSPLGELAEDGASLSLVCLQNGKWLAAYRARAGTEHHDVWLVAVDAARPAESRPLQVHVAGSTVAAVQVSGDGTVYCVSIDEDASERILTCSAGQLSDAGWHELIPVQSGTSIEAFRLLEGVEAQLLVWRRSGSARVLQVFDPLTGFEVLTLGLPGVGAIVSISQPVPGDSIVHFGYTDPVTPGDVFSYDGQNRSVVRIFATEQTQLTSRYITFAGPHGNEISLCLLTSGANCNPGPTLLTTYGGFGVSTLEHFDAAAAAWVAAGGTWVSADMILDSGPDRDLAGRSRQLDAIECLTTAARWLLDQGVTTPSQLSLFGGSNGGLLAVGAMLARPDLFAAVTCVAAPLDMVRYERFGLGSMWKAEYGSAADPRQLPRLLSLSPYHNVRPGVKYPAVLLASFENDTRVSPAHTRKMCAALQYASRSSRPVITLCLPNVGHGRRGLDRRVELAANTLGFLASFTGLGDSSSAGGEGEERSDPPMLTRESSRSS